MKHILGLAIVAGSFAASSAQAQSSTYTFDPTHTFATFEFLHFNASTIRGRFDKKEGTLQFDRAGKSGRVEIAIDTASINTGVPPFDANLRGKDFFNSTEHPTAKFVSDRFVFDGDKVSEVVGTLTLLGITHPVKLKANNFNCYMNPLFKREVCGGDFETTLKRSLWGINYAIAQGAPDGIRLLVQVEAIKQ